MMPLDDDITSGTTRGLLWFLAIVVGVSLVAAGFVAVVRRALGVKKKSGRRRD